MKRYVFSLHRVLRVRETQESVARQVLRAAAEHAAQADDDYDMKARNYEANVASAASLRGSVLNMLAFRDAAARRAQAVLDAEETRESAQTGLRQANESWADAKRKLSALEHLDERQRAEYRLRELSEEQAQADEGTRRRRPVAPPENGEEASR
jgi:flagellar export protein FliJ